MLVMQKQHELSVHGEWTCDIAGSEPGRLDGLAKPLGVCWRCTDTDQPRPADVCGAKAMMSAWLCKHVGLKVRSERTCSLALHGSWRQDTGAELKLLSLEPLLPRRVTDLVT